MKQKILIIGALADFGGREAEVNNLIVVLSDEYDVKIFSTGLMTEKSMAVDNNKSQWTSIYKELYNSSLLLKGLALMSKKWNKSNLPSYLLVSNKVSSIFFNFNKENLCILKKQIDSVQVVLFCGILSNGFLKDSIDYCLATKKPFILRTTGTIKDIPLDLKDLLHEISSILLHSYCNASIFRSNNIKNISVVDQTSLIEESLLNILIRNNTILTYGYIGRFSPEKGIVELLEIFKELDKRLIIAGNGPLLSQVESSCESSLFLEYIGEIPYNKIVDFFNKIDVLIIPSFEESGPLVGIEAMAAGKIIITTRVGAMMDRLNTTSNQFWFDINDNKSLLSTISELESLDPDSVVNVRKELREVYKEKYSKKTISMQYLDVINNCLKID